MGLLDHLTGLAGLTDDVREEIALAFAFSERGDFGTAVSRLSALAEAHPRAVPVQLALGELRARQADDEGAVAAFGRAVDLSVDAVDGWLGLGEALVRLGRPDPARDAFRRVLSQSDDPPRRARAHAGRGRLALAAGRLAKAVRELRRAAELAPEEITVAADLGRALVAARDPEGSQWLMRAARAALDGDAADLTLVTEAAASLPTGKAAEELLRAAASSPRLDDGARAVAQAALARRLAEGSRLDEARTLAAAALAAAPSSAPVLAAWRDVARAGGDYREALRAARRAV